MKNITKAKLKQIIQDHQHFLKQDCIGWENMRANLDEANLSNAVLDGVNLSKASLRGANLSGADLYRANLSGAILYGVDLSKAYLNRADLTGTDLRQSNLSGANLSDANLRVTDLSHADLRDASLSGAHLGGAILDDVTALDGVIYNDTTSFFKPCCPEEGSFVAYKQARMYSNTDRRVIVKLQVTDTAMRSSATTRKCRVSEAKVISITSLDGKKSLKKARAGHEPTFVYEVGKTVKVKNFDTCRWTECAPGIHCFLTREEAIQY